MFEFINPYLFGLVLTLFSGSLFWFLKAFKNLSLINPLLFSVIFIISILYYWDIPYEDYKKGSDLIHMFLGPITVILALPLYEHKDKLLLHKKAIFAGTMLGSLSAFLSVLFLGYLFGLSDIFVKSLLVKSMTTPIGISASSILDAILGLSVFSIVFTGIFGAFISPLVFKVLGIKSSIAKGIALGTTSHAVGTAKAYEINKVCGAMSSLSIGLAGVIGIFWISLYILYLANP